MQSSSIINAVKTETLACFMPCVLRANCESLEHLSSSWSVLLNAGAAAMQETEMEARKRARGEHFTFRKCPRHNAMVRPCAACTHSPSFSPQASAGVRNRQKTANTRSACACSTTAKVQALKHACRSFTPSCRGHRFVRRGSAACCRTALYRQACCWPICSRGFVHLGLKLKEE